VEDGTHVNLFDDFAGVAKKLDFIHNLWPDRAVFIGQWGDETAGGQQRDPALTRDYIHGFVELVRQRPYVVGVSFWAFATTGVAGPMRAPPLTAIVTSAL
jgi:hypothetical protein